MMNKPLEQVYVFLHVNIYMSNCISNTNSISVVPQPSDLICSKTIQL